MIKNKKFLVFILIICILACSSNWKQHSVKAASGNDIVSVAKRELGVSGRPNKYTYWYGAVGGTYSYAWCHAFVSWCASEAGGGDLVPKTASCYSGAQWFKNKGQWKERSSGYIPKAGDIIYFDWDTNGGWDHVGIVNYVSGERVYIIDGNSGGYPGTVKEHNYSLYDNEIIGYGTPEYDASNPPTNPQISKSQVWYDLGDTIAVSAYIDNATGYYMSMFKDGEKIVGQGMADGKFSMPASQYGEGHYSFYFTCCNSAGSVDTEWLDFDVVGSAGYSDIWTSKPIYDIDDTVSISVSTICAKGQCVGIDKDGVGRVITELSDSTYTISANQLGFGHYTAYFTVYNGSGSVDTKCVEFTISERCNLGDEFFAQIKNIGTDKYISNIGGNVKGENIDCDRSRTWLFVRLNDGSYKIINSLDYGAMDVTDYGNSGNGTNIQMNTNWDTTAQRFYIYQAYGAYYIKPVCCEMFLDMDQNAPYNLAAWGGGVNWAPQKFEINKINSDDVGVHKYKSEITKEPTCAEEGVQTYTCAVCGDNYQKSIDKTDHIYSTEWTIDKEATSASEGSKSHHCINCDSKTDITAIPKLDEVKASGTFSISEGTAGSDDIAEVYINITNNPGIVGATLAVEYDTEKLQLIACEDLGILNDYQWSEMDRNPFLMNWEDPSAEENNTSNGNIAKLKFKVLSDLGEEGTELKLSVDTAYDVNIEDVEFSTANGRILMKKYTPGDVNEDVENKGVISAGTVSGSKGEIVGVPITLEMNPGIIAIQCRLKYDKTKVKLVRVEGAGMLEDSALSEDYTKNPYILSFGDGLGTSDVSTIGTLATAYFEILPDFTEGKTEIELVYDSAYDKDINEVMFSSKNGSIEVKKYIPGDVNEDGQVRLNDAILLRRYVAGWDVTINLDAADVNRDGQVRLNDAILLRRYVAGWDVTLK